MNRYMKKKEYSKAINVVDQANAHCSIQLPLEMAVVYSVSLLHTGRGQDVCYTNTNANANDYEYEYEHYKLY